jgi:hypothetical protein
MELWAFYTQSLQSYFNLTKSYYASTILKSWSTLEPYFHPAVPLLCRDLCWLIGSSRVYEDEEEWFHKIFAGLKEDASRTSMSSSCSAWVAHPFSPRGEVLMLDLKLGPKGGELNPLVKYVLHKCCVNGNCLNAYIRCFYYSGRRFLWNYWTYQSDHGFLWLKMAQCQK